MIDLFIPGKPPTQGSVRAHATPNGKVVVRPSDSGLGVWRATLRAEFERYPSARLEGPVSVGIFVTLARPKSHYRTGKNAALWRTDAPMRPTGKPDLDKIVRAVLDGLTYAGAWNDDSQVVRIEASKAYADCGGHEVGVRVWAKTPGLVS